MSTEVLIDIEQFKTPSPYIIENAFPSSNFFFLSRFPSKTAKAIKS